MITRPKLRLFLFAVLVLFLWNQRSAPVLAAEDEKVDMITVGSVGIGGIHAKKSLGSISRNVAEISTRPVLIVP